MARERGEQQADQGRGTRAGGKRGAPAAISAEAQQMVAGVIDAYGRRYHERTGSLFSENDGFTPVLKCMIETLRGGREPRRRTMRTIVEAGAGPGVQAIHLASGAARTKVIAVEPNAGESGIHRNVAAARSGFKERSDVLVDERPITAVLRGFKPGSIDAVHAHSLLHLWNRETRAEFLGAAHLALVEGGTLGITFKAEGDAQQRRAKPVRRKSDAAGIYGKDPVYSNIVRLFVNDPSAIVAELAESGFELVREPVRWSHRGYDFPNEDAQFVGFVARKIIQP